MVVHAIDWTGHQAVVTICAQELIRCWRRQKRTVCARAQPAAVDPLHDQHALRGQLLVHVRHKHPVQPPIQRLQVPTTASDTVNISVQAAFSYK